MNDPVENYTRCKKKSSARATKSLPLVKRKDTKPSVLSASSPSRLEVLNDLKNNERALFILKILYLIIVDVQGFVMNFANSHNTHDCALDEENILGRKLKPHIDCSKADEEGLTIYTVYWDHHVSCVIQKDGPVYIMDYRSEPFLPKLYPNIRDAIEPLNIILSAM